MAELTHVLRMLGIPIVGEDYLVLKHQKTGEIVGFSAPFSVPTRAVWATKTMSGWQEREESHG